MSKLKYGHITGEILAAAFDVHNYLGSGFQEVIYQRALSYELHQRRLEHGREVEHEIFYKDVPEPIGVRRADFLVEEKVIVEIKACKELTDVHWAQTINYLEAFRREVALLINFGGKSVEFKRFMR